MLGFSYDWDREVDTTDPHYFKWTQWIFLQIFDSWYDAEKQRGRPIAELPIPPEVKKQFPEPSAIRQLAKAFSETRMLTETASPDEPPDSNEQ